MSQSKLHHTTLEDREMVYTYSTVSADHLMELQEFMDGLIEDGKPSANETFREYIKNARYALPEALPDAKSIIVFALYVPLMKTTFQLDGREHEVLIPPQYYRLGLPEGGIATVIRSEILPDGQGELERVMHAHQKLLAVRSGLARYGRNNITYVDGMGSFLALVAYATDVEFPDQWTELQAMPQCATCTICLDNCPTGAIRPDEFVIDAGKCLPLYNEAEGSFPDWLPESAHNALIGCMHCQLPCPANREVVAKAERLPDLNEAETRAILDRDKDSPELASAAEKLRIGLSDTAVLDVVSRNLACLLPAGD